MATAVIAARVPGQNIDVVVEAEPVDRLKRERRVAALIVIYGVTLAFSLYRINLPLLDFYPVRQIQTADITRNLYQNWDFSKPVRYNGPDLKAFILEFPLYNAVVAFGYAATGGVDESMGRLVSVAAWLCAGFCLYVLVRRFYGETTALVALFFFHMSRMGIQVSRSFQPDAGMVLLAMAAMVTWDGWLRRSAVPLPILPMACTTLAFLVKLPIAHLALPIAYLAGFAGRKQRLYMLVSAGVAVLIAAVWNAHARTLTIAETPEIAGNWALDNWFVPALLVSPEFYSKLYLTWRADLFGSVVFALALFGALMRPPTPRHYVFHVWMAATIAYLLFFNYHASTHYYYNVPLLPVGAVFAARAFVVLPEMMKGVLFINPRLIQAGVLGMVLLTTGRAVSARAYDIPANEAGVLPAAAEIRRLTPENTLVISPGMVIGYYADRPGWGVRPRDANAVQRVEELRAQGARVFATGDLAELAGDVRMANHLAQSYSVLSAGPHFVIYDLNTPAQAGALPFSPAPRPPSSPQ